MPKTSAQDSIRNTLGIVLVTRSFVGTILLVVVCMRSPSPSIAIPSPSIVDQVEIRHGSEQGSHTYALPIYQVGDIRFISGGVGKSERQANFPSFPLKLIFVETPNAYVTQVGIEIRDQKENMILNLSKHQIVGPWLYVDLPPGTYTVRASREDQLPLKRQLTIKDKGTQITHFHWPKLEP